MTALDLRFWHVEDGRPVKLDGDKLIAEAILAGQAVPEGALWGAQALRLVAEGLVLQADIDRRRYQHLRTLEGQTSAAEAAEIADQLEQRHERAQNIFRDADGNRYRALTL